MELGILSHPRASLAQARVNRAMGHMKKMWSRDSGTLHTQQLPSPFQCLFLRFSPVWSLSWYANHMKTLIFKGSLLPQSIFILLFSTHLFVSILYIEHVVYMPFFSKAHFTWSWLSEIEIWHKVWIRCSHCLTSKWPKDRRKCILHSPSTQQSLTLMVLLEQHS